MLTIWAFDNIENKHTLYCGEHCMKKFCESLREHAKNIINFEKQKNVTVNKRRTKITSRSVRDHYHFTGKYRPAVHSICNLNFHVPSEISVLFQNSSNYDYHFIIKELANNFEGQFECLVENTEKYKFFSIPIEKEVTNFDKDGNESVFTVSYRVKFIDSSRFVASSLSNLVDYLAEIVHKIKCKDCACFLEYESVKDNLIKYKRLSCNKDYSNKLAEK